MKVSGRRVEWRRLAAHTGLLTLASAVLSLPASAAAGGQALPWEQPLTRLQQSLSGPVAGAIAIIALVAIGVTLVFGGGSGMNLPAVPCMPSAQLLSSFPRLCCLAGRVVRGRGAAVV